MKHMLYKLMTGLLLVILIPALSPAPVSAVDSIQVIIGDSGSIPWSLSNLKPGDSGTQTVSVSNTGSIPGELRIWVSGISGTEGTPLEFGGHTLGDTGELKEYLVLQVQAVGLATNITMPALVTAFPGNDTDSRYVKIATVNPDQTVYLTWLWSLPPATGNMVQGDSLSFDINYTLSQIISPPPAPTNQPTGKPQPPSIPEQPPFTITQPLPPVPTQTPSIIVISADDNLWWLTIAYPVVMGAVIIFAVRRYSSHA
ncbi:hypothetical protein CVH13_00231 [Dehalococcoides mccartyi]|uniref:Uncharacterized protein n=1 Tax=Dehalococcoides mccartyi TaxID=61435 RepID=A0A2J1E068_9CHLR|nr:hypothetical protein CVH13_00231 [Dehalococcoides mccartyi]